MRSPSDMVLVGLSHRTAPVEVRERLALGGPQLAPALSQMHALPGIDELMLVATCNRVEAYLWGAERGADEVLRWLAASAGVDPEGFFYRRSSEEAVQHLFRVCASLDSMVLGEPQILGQVKEAFAAARRAGTLGPGLSSVCQAAFSAAKRVRTETAIGAASVSMASAAVDLARALFRSLEGRTVLLVGAGAMGELVARHLAGSASQLVATNRTPARARELASRVGARAVSFDALPELLREADIVVTCTAASSPVLTVAMLEAATRARQWRPLYLLDLAVPRDVEEGAAKLEGVFVYDVDDLEEVAREGRAARESEARAAEAIVREEAERFARARAIREAVPVVGRLRSHADAIARSEIDRTLAQFGEAWTLKQRRSIEAMGKAIVNKLLHTATVRLREAGERAPGEAAALAEVVSLLFDLDAQAEPASLLPADPADPPDPVESDAPGPGVGRA